MTRKKGSKNKKNKEIIDVPSDVVDKVLNETVIMRPKTRADVMAEIKRLDPDCGRGGCLHPKSEHYAGNDYPNECHKCSCQGFIES